MPKYLIDNGADVNLKASPGDTPLHKAANVGSIDSAQLLVEARGLTYTESINGLYTSEIGVQIARNGAILNRYPVFGVCIGKLVNSRGVLPEEVYVVIMLIIDA